MAQPAMRWTARQVIVLRNPRVFNYLFVNRGESKKTSDNVWLYMYVPKTKVMTSGDIGEVIVDGTITYCLSGNVFRVSRRIDHERPTA